MGYAVPIIGGAFQASGTNAEYKRKSDELKNTARAEQENALLAKAVGKNNAAKQTLSAGKKIGQIKSDYAASGVEADSGSVLDILRQSYSLAESDRLNILFGAELDAINAENRASAATSGAEHLDRTRGEAAAGAFFGAVAPTLGREGGSSGKKNSTQGSGGDGGGGGGGDATVGGGSYMDAGSIA